MPYIQCDIRKGRSAQQKAALRDAVTRAVQETIGSPLEYIFVVIREAEGKHYIEGGVPNPDWTPNENPEWSNHNA